MRTKNIQKTQRGKGSRRIKLKNKKIKRTHDTPSVSESLFSRDLGLKANYNNLNITYDVNVFDRLTKDRIKGEGKRKSD